MPDQTPRLGGQPVMTQAPVAIDPNAVLRRVLEEYPGLARVHSPDDTAVQFAPPERIAQATRYMEAQGYGKGPGHLEYWPKDETGTPEYPHPGPGKTVLEIFNPELMSDEARLKNAIYGDLMHGMDRDPDWAAMREEFKQGYTPQELERIQARQSWWQDANGTGGRPNAGHDAYIRGYLNERDAAMKGAVGNIRQDGAIYQNRQSVRY